MNPSDSVPRHRQGMDYGDSEDVQKVHAAIQREKQEPRVGLEVPISVASPEASVATVWIQAQFRPNHTGLAPVAEDSNRSRSLRPPSAEKKFLWRIARYAIKRADSDRKVRDIRRLPVLKLPTAAPVAPP